MITGLTIYIAASYCIFSKNQISAGTLMTPVLMIFIFIPVFSEIIKMLAEVVLSIFVFLFFYKKNGFEKD